MKILGIETSCDETAVCVIEADGDIHNPNFKVLGNALYSQIKIHAEYGGVFPALAKREHSKNLVPLLKKVLEEVGKGRSPLSPTGLGLADMATTRPEGPRSVARPFPTSSSESDKKIAKILEREPELLEAFTKFIKSVGKPDIDLIAVASGPGLEPALWVGINFALALHEIWNIPVMPVNHMEGHIASVLIQHKEEGGISLPAHGYFSGEKFLELAPSRSLGAVRETPPSSFSQSAPIIQFPILALLISGGHTELVLAKSWRKYEIVGATRDDAVGEAFDKIARILGLPYPGGPEISMLAEDARNKNIKSEFDLPRPMINSGDLDFSFSGLKTAVLYMVKKIEDVNDDIRRQIALEAENAITEVLVSKTQTALEKYMPKTLVVGGGVIANSHIRQALATLAEHFPDTAFHIPDKTLTGDNAIMIAMAGYCDFLSGKKTAETIRAEGNLKL